MARLIILDSSPLSLGSDRAGKPLVDRCNLWMDALLASRARIIIPEIIDYEVRRELLRIRATSSLRRLDILKDRLAYEPLSTPAMLRAAEFWAIVRQQGRPTAAAEAIDADCILAAQAVTATQPGDSSVIATTNVGRLARFPGVVAQAWESIT